MPPETPGSHHTDSEHEADDEPARKRRRKWFDPASVHKGHTQATAALAKFRSDLEKVKTEGVAAVKQHDTLSPAYQEALKNEHVTVQKRLAWMLAVLGTEQTALQKLKDEVTAKSAKAPCEMWKELELVTEAEKHSQTVFETLATEAKSQDEVKAAVERVKGLRHIFKSICSSTSKACADWKNRLRSLDRVRQQEAKAQEKYAQKAGGAANRGGGAPKQRVWQPKPIFDAGAALAHELPNIVWSDAMMADLSKPFSSRRPQATADMEAAETKARACKPALFRLQLCVSCRPCNLACRLLYPASRADGRFRLGRLARAEPRQG